nr:hypothetical protein [Tanacetum cinerariifolium]
MYKHLEESTRRRAEMEEWVKKLQENAQINTQNQSASLKNLETQIEQLTKEFHTKAVNKINNSTFDHWKAVYADKKTPYDNGQHKEQGRSYKKPRKLKFDINLPNTHFYKPVKQILKGELKFWPTCDPNIRECNGGHEIYGMDEEGVIKNGSIYKEVKFEVSSTLFHVEARFYLGITTRVTP